MAEAEGLKEIDTYATNAKHKDEVKEEVDDLILQNMQTGSNWSKVVTRNTGARMCEYDIYELRKETKET